MPYLPPSPYQQFCPPALTEAAVPLAATRRVLRALSDDAAGLRHLAEGSPTPAVREAFDAFLAAWSGRLFELAGDAGTLATNLRWAAEEYRSTEQALHDAAMAQSPRTRS